MPALPVKIKLNAADGSTVCLGVFSSQSEQELIDWVWSMAKALKAKDFELVVLAGCDVAMQRHIASLARQAGLVQVYPSVVETLQAALPQTLAQ